MATVDFNAAYSDATKGATLKALQLRQKQAEEEMQQQMRPQQIISPLQGWAQIAGTVGAGIREGRAAAQEQAGRQQLAQLLAGGLKDPQSMAQAMMLDPELAGKYQEHQWNVEDAVQRAREAQAAQERGFAHEDVSQQAGFKHADEAAAQQAKVQEEHARLEATLGTDEAKWEAGLKAGTVSQEAYDTHKQQVAAEAAARGPDQWAPVTPDIASKYDPRSDVAVNPGKYEHNAKTGETRLIDTRSLSSMLGPGQARTDTEAAKDINDWETGGKVGAALEIANIRRGIGLLRQGGPSTTGTLAGASDKILSNIPYVGEALNRAWNGQGLNARDAILSSVQRSLKSVLGSQFTRIEGENLLGRAFNMNASVDENIHRAEMILGQAELLAKQKDEMARYFHSTDSGKPADSMYGAKAAQLDTSGLETMLNDMANADASGNPNQGSGGSTDAAPPPEAIHLLKSNPALRNDFDAKYGQGAAAKVLGN